jgi:hypothetical protein
MVSTFLLSDIYDGNFKLTMGLIWSLIQFFQLSGSGGMDKNALLTWLNVQCGPDVVVSCVSEEKDEESGEWDE